MCLSRGATGFWGCWPRPMEQWSCRLNHRFVMIYSFRTWKCEKHGQQKERPRLFNRDNFVLTGTSAALGFFAYFTMNVCFTGVPVPTGNFTGTMVIGGMAGRVLGSNLADTIIVLCQGQLFFEFFVTAKVQGDSEHEGHELGTFPDESGMLSLWFPSMDFASNGIYSMIGAAAMLSSFKQMSVACVLFISCSNSTAESQTGRVVKPFEKMPTTSDYIFTTKVIIKDLCQRFIEIPHRNCRHKSVPSDPRRSCK